MSALAGGIATFASCNKAGSIPQFTQHLQSRPNDFTALYLRGQAHAIIGQNQNARADFEKAARVGPAPEKYIAQMQTEFMAGNLKKGIEILQTTLKNYPTFSQGRSELARLYKVSSDFENALTCFEKAHQLAITNGETQAPWYSWSNYHAGLICKEQGHIDKAARYFETAIQSCDTLTVAYFELSKCHLRKNNTPKARELFDKARNLNPTLIHWANFDEFLGEITQASLSSKMGDMSLQPSGNSASGVTGRGGGSGDGSGSDDEDPSDKWKRLPKGKRWEMEDWAKLERTEKWKELRSVASEEAVYGKDIKMIKIDDYWYSRDTARHAGAFLKKYADKRSSLDFVGSVDENMRDMAGKHESKKFPSIHKRDLNGCRKLRN